MQHNRKNLVPLRASGALQDEKYIFRVGTTKAEPFHARHVLRTIVKRERTSSGEELEAFFTLSPAR